jgi:hypothetical protein
MAAGLTPPFLPFLPFLPLLPFLPSTIAPMARYTLVYGLRLIPEGSIRGLTDATLKLADGTTAGLTLHTIDGTVPQLRRALDRSLDAFFDLLPGAEEEDLDTFGD